MNTVIHTYLQERKDDWLKKNLKDSMDEAEKAETLNKAHDKYSLPVWIMDAAKRAGQLSITTHLSKFSHPSAKTSPIIADCVRSNDGYLRSGNVEYSADVTGNAAALDVYKFLCLMLDDGRTILDHLEEDSAFLKEILSLPTDELTTVKQGLLAAKKDLNLQTTSDLVKQVYFPVEDKYHLLSVLTPSGLLTKIKKQVDEIRFSEQAKEARKLHRAGEFHHEGYDDLLDLTVIAFGGTKPQNISFLNSQNGGVAYLLRSCPPILQKRNVRLPRKDFFYNTLQIKFFKNYFQYLHSLMKRDYKRLETKEEIKIILQSISDQIIYDASTVRAQEAGWSKTDYYQALPQEQRIWLDDAYKEEREDQSEWLDSIAITCARWIIRAYEKTLRNNKILLGDVELNEIRDLIAEVIIYDKEFFK